MSRSYSSSVPRVEIVASIAMEPLRVEVFDLIAEGVLFFEMTPHGLVSRLRFVMQRGRQLER